MKLNYYQYKLLLFKKDLKSQWLPFYNVSVEIGKDETFDENCCRKKNVSEECMGNCKDKRDLTSDTGTGKSHLEKETEFWELENRCKMFEKEIKTCIIPREGYWIGLIEILKLYHFIDNSV